MFVCLSCKNLVEKLYTTEVGDKLCHECYAEDVRVLPRASYERFTSLYMAKWKEYDGPCRECGGTARRTCDGFLCQKCFMDVARLAIGCYRADTLGRCFKVIPWSKPDRVWRVRRNGKIDRRFGDTRRSARYPFGDSPCPRYSTLSSEDEWNKQSAKMWELVMDHLNLAKKIARSMSKHPDAFHDGCLPSLMRAAATYDASKAMFSTYASVACQRGMIRWLRSRRPTEELFDNLSTEPFDVAIAGVQHAAHVIDYLGKHVLSPRDLYILEQHFVHNRTLESIGQEFGVIRSAIFMRIKRCIRRCKDANLEEV